MSSTTVHTVHPVAGTGTSTSGPASTSLLTKLSSYISEHKAVVYTVGAVLIVATAGGIYYISQSGSEGEAKEKKIKKDRRKKDTKDSTSGKADIPGGEIQTLYTPAQCHSYLHWRGVRF